MPVSVPGRRRFAQYRNPTALLLQTQRIVLTRFERTFFLKDG